MAGRIPQAFIDDIVARSDIVEVIGARVPLKKSGREFKANCPFHNEKSPSFWVSPDKQFYHCFGCGAHGTVIGFLMQYEKMEFLDAVADLAQRAGMELPREAAEAREPGGVDLHDITSKAARFFAQNLADNPRALAYVERRGIDAKTAENFALGYAPDAWDALLNRFGSHDEERRRLLQVGLIVERDTRGGERAAGYYDRFRDRLMFPIRDSRGRVIGFGGRVLDKGDPKYLNSPETPLFHKGRELYGLYEARRAHADFKRLMIVEGYMDVVRLHQAGITYAVATLGTATTQEHLNKVFRHTSEVVFCFDGDRAGRAAAWRALENALPMARDGRELKFMFLPEGHDPDTLVAAEGREAFEARLKTALQLSEYLLQHLTADIDLAHDEGRAKLKALATPLFAKIPAGIYRELLADRLATTIRMPATKLKEYLFAAAAVGRTAQPAEPNAGGHGQTMLGKVRADAGRGGVGHNGAGRSSVGRGNLLSQAIALVLHHPAAARQVSQIEALAKLDRPGVSVLKELLEEAAAMSEPSTAMLLERWRGRPEHRRLCELALGGQDLVADPAGTAKELQMAVEKLLEEYGPGRRMDDLLRKAEEMGLNSDEKTELTLLLKAKGRARSP
jgi:DNA primase